MIHLLFLIASLGLVCLGQKLLLLVLLQEKNWWVRRSLQLLALAMPLSALALSALTMFPTLLAPEAHHESNQSVHEELVIAVLGFSLFCLPVLGALLFNFSRLVWLYVSTLRRTWRAPTGLEKLAVAEKHTRHNLASLTGSQNRPVVRLWYSSRSFAFNLPGLWPKSRPVIVLSTAMVEKLGPEELQAVLWHELSHLARHDFWIIWLASWWRNAFFYLPLGGRFVTHLQNDQELACDDKVARQGGLAMALALAEALLKVWEETATGAMPGAGEKRSVKIISHFEAPGLGAEQEVEISLTEQRVTRLIERSQAEPESFPIKAAMITRLKAGSLLGGSVGLWLVGLELMHMFMFPLGCAISLGVI